MLSDAHCGWDAARSPITLVDEVHMPQRMTVVPHTPSMSPQGWSGSSFANYGLWQLRADAATSQLRS